MSALKVLGFENRVQCFGIQAGAHTLLGRVSLRGL